MEIFLTRNTKEVFHQILEIILKHRDVSHNTKNTEKCFTKYWNYWRSISVNARNTREVFRELHRSEKCAW